MDKRGLSTIGAIVALVTVFCQLGFFLVSGGNAIGTQVAEQLAEVRFIRQEFHSRIQLLNYRVTRLEDQLGIKQVNGNGAERTEDK